MQGKIYQGPNGNVSRARLFFDVLVGVLDRDVGESVVFISMITLSVSISLLSVMFEREENRNRICNRI